MTEMSIDQRKATLAKMKSDAAILAKEIAAEEIQLRELKSQTVLDEWSVTVGALCLFSDFDTGTVSVGILEGVRFVTLGAYSYEDTPRFEVTPLEVPGQTLSSVMRAYRDSPVDTCWVAPLKKLDEI